MFDHEQPALQGVKLYAKFSAAVFWLFSEGVGVQLVCGPLGILAGGSNEISFPLDFILHLPIFGT